VEVGGVTLTAAMALAAGVMVWYFLLDVPLGLAMLGVTVVLLYLGKTIADLGTAAAWAWFGALFVGGWALQLVGHMFEGRKPALVDNLVGIFIAPLFLVAEVFFALGYKPKLHAAAQARALRMRAEAADSKLTAAG
jgi:uncharacterized membrane protein YGL010W